MPVELKKQKWCGKPGQFPIKHQRTTWTPSNCFALANLSSVTRAMAVLTHAISIINHRLEGVLKYALLCDSTLLDNTFLIAWKLSVTGDKKNRQRKMESKQSKRQYIEMLDIIRLYSPLWLAGHKLTHISVMFPYRYIHKRTTATVIKSANLTYYSIRKSTNFPTIKSLY